MGLASDCKSMRADQFDESWRSKGVAMILETGARQAARVETEPN
jgi:hypothetical protein